MSVRTEFTIWCDAEGCSMWLGYADSRKQLAKDAVRSGWSVTRRTHRCPRHAGRAPQVHVLHEGSALCRMPGVPAEWPECDRWVRIGEEGATCETCAAAAKELEEERRPRPGTK